MCLSAVFDFAYISRLGLAHDDVQYRDVAARLAGIGRHHSILRLQQASHDVQDGGLANGLGRLYVVTREWGVARLQEMASRVRDQARDDADQIVVHVAWVAQSGG